MIGGHRRQVATCRNDRDGLKEAAHRIGHDDGCRDDCELPWAQLGWQLFTWKVPVPWALLAPHVDQVIPVTDVLPVAHPM